MEIRGYQERRHQFNRVCVAGLFAIFFAILGPFKKDFAELYFVAWMSPFALSIGCYLFQLHTNNAIRLIGRYVKRIEKKYADPGLLGWENTVFALREHTADNSATNLEDDFPELPSSYSRFSESFWMALSLMFGALGILAVSLRFSGVF